VGELTDRRGTQGGDIEEYELVALEKKDTHEASRKQLRRLKRDEKRRWLDEQDDMKFSHSIQFNAVPDWSSHYIAYSNLKKMYVYHRHLLSWYVSDELPEYISSKRPSTSPPAETPNPGLLSRTMTRIPSSYGH